MASEPTAAASASAAEETQVTFNIKAANDQKFVMTVPLATTTTDLKQKLSTPEYADIPAERIRLIYSGRVLKDTDTLQSAKIKDGHTIHMVKGAASNARQAPSAQSGGASGVDIAGSTAASAASAAANVPTSFATGTGAGNPLAGLTGARYAGFANLPSASMFGADGGMGGPNPNELLRMLDDPNMLSQMSEMMNNPDFIRMMEQNPMLANNPQMRQIIRDPEMRRMMFNPQMIRMQLEMQRRMGGGMPGMGGGGEAFPMPGATDTTPGQTGAAAATAAQGDAAGQAGGAAAANPFASLFGGAGGMGAQGNPFAAMMGGAQPGQTPAQAPSNPTQPGQDAQNPMFDFMQSMQALQALQGGAGGNGAATGANNPFASLFGPGFGGAAQQPQAPPDNRPPEERYAEQLRQLNDMGFFEFERNVQALRRSGGSVQGAIEYLLSNP